MKKWFLWTMPAVQAAENHGDEWGLTWYLTSIPTWTHSQNSLATVEALSLKISFHGTSLKSSGRPSQSAQESHKLCDETWHLVLSSLENQWKLRKQHDQNFPMEEKLLQSKYLHQKIEINPKQQVCESHSRDLSRKVNHVSKTISDRTVITEFTRSISSTRIV